MVMRKPDARRKHQTKRKIRWSRLLLVIALPILIMSCLGVSGYALYLPQLTNMLEVTATTAGKFKNMPALKNQINILLLGIEDAPPGEGSDAARRSDAMVVAGINFDDCTVRLLSVPRDTLATIPGRKEGEKINHAYAHGGVSLARSTAENFLQTPLHHYVVVDCQAFAKIIDALGGIDLYVENNMKYQDPYAGLNIDLKQGYQRLSGKQAIEYVRFRSDEMGDIGRVHRQQKFLKAFLRENIKISNLWKLPALTETAKQSVYTDITLFTALKMTYAFLRLEPNGVKTEMIPGRFATIDGVSYWEADPEQTKRLIDDVFYQ